VNFWKPILAAVVIFAAGFVTGSLTLDLRRPPAVQPAWNTPSASPQSPQDNAQPRQRGGPPSEGSPRDSSPREGQRDGPGPSRERHLEALCKRMEHDLNLDAAQRDQVESIIRQTHERVQTLVDGVKPQTHAEFQRMEQEIKAVLTPEQIEKFDEMARQRRERPFRR
jgi:Spy/CpxP family protein refolding chaperone